MVDYLPKIIWNFSAWKIWFWLPPLLPFFLSVFFFYQYELMDFYTWSNNTVILYFLLLLKWFHLEPPGVLPVGSCVSLTSFHQCRLLCRFLTLVLKSAISPRILESILDHIRSQGMSSISIPTLVNFQQHICLYINWKHSSLIIF